MPVDLTVVDWILLGGMAVLALIGLFRGISGELGSLVGLAAGVLAGVLLYAPSVNCATAFGFAQRGEAMLKGAALVIDIAFAILVGGLVRLLIRKFVSFLVGRVLDAVLGLLSGVIKGVLLVGVLTGTGLISTGPAAEGALASHAPLVDVIASCAQGFSGGSRP